MNLMLHILIHTFIQLLSPLSPLGFFFFFDLSISHFTDLARKKTVSVLVHLFEMQN